MYQLKRIETKADWKSFINLPWKIYKNEPCWVPPLKISVRNTLDVSKNPFFRHAIMYPLIAFKDGTCVGRVVGIIDDNHNRFHKEKMAFFGFFEAIDDQSLANLLFDEVTRWAKTQGMTSLRGPMNPSTNHECGLLIDGFDDSPTVMNTYNPPYYAKLFESWGLKKIKDLFAFLMDTRVIQFSDKLLAQAEKLKQNSKVSFRPINLKNFEREVELILDIYNDAWEQNWGFVPMDPEEFRHMAKDMRAILDPQLLLIAEVSGKPAGFALTIPDVNLAIKKIKNGKLFPTGLLKLLWYTRGPFRKKIINRCRILTLGIKKEFRPLGIGPLLYSEFLKRGPANGYLQGEASWILEDNVPMNRAIENMGGKKTKIYRIFERVL